jgi:hypothetical protein
LGTVTNKVDKEKTNKFFSPIGKINAITLIALNEIKQRNNAKEFVSEFSQNYGFPIWSESIVAERHNQDTIVYIPLVLTKTRFVNGFIRVIINKGISISSFKSSEFNIYTSSVTTFNSDNYASLFMYFDYMVFRHERFILTDPSLFSSFSSDKKYIENRQLKLSATRRSNPFARITDCELFTIYIDWLVKDPGNCTCYDHNNCDWATGCPDCSNSFTTTFTYADCGGNGGSTTTSGTWTPNPPPSGGGSSTIATPSGGFLLYPNTQEYYDFVDYTLNPNEQNFWNDPYKAEFVAPLIKQLVDGNYSSSTVTIIKFWLDYLMGNPDITSAEFENYFMYNPNEQDGIYDGTYWDNPNLTFQQVALPSFQPFISAFPKIINQDNTITYMPSSDVYTLVGGNMNVQNKAQNPYYQNACAIRGSRALNYCGQTIDNSATATELGDDGKKYMLVRKRLINT